MPTVYPVKIEVICALPRLASQVILELPLGAKVADALALYHAADETRLGQAIVGYAIFGQHVEANAELRDGDRLELLRPLQADPKEARRRRARQLGGSA